jgi:hemerythrin-like metal-binding protein
MDRIIECSKELISTTLVHFRSEERAMDANPRDFTTHKRVHANMIESLRDISNDLEQRRITGAMELMKFFEEQLTYHLDVEDAALDRELIRS